MEQKNRKKKQLKKQPTMEEYQSTLSSIIFKLPPTLKQITAMNKAKKEKLQQQEKENDTKHYFKCITLNEKNNEYQYKEVSIPDQLSDNAYWMYIDQNGIFIVEDYEVNPGHFIVVKENGIMTNVHTWYQAEGEYTEEVYTTLQQYMRYEDKVHNELIEVFTPEVVLL